MSFPCSSSSSSSSRPSLYNPDSPPLPGRRGSMPAAAGAGSSSSATSDSSNVPLIHSTRKILGASSFLNGDQIRRISECGQVVCQIRTPNPKERGTGFLIGGILLLTNHHVLRNREVAGNSFAYFFEIVDQNSKGETYVKIVKIALRPDIFFETSPDRSPGGPVEAARDGLLDFTVVALDPTHPYLSNVQHAILSIFETVPIGLGNGSSEELGAGPCREVDS